MKPAHAVLWIVVGLTLFSCQRPAQAPAASAHEKGSGVCRRIEEPAVFDPSQYCGLGRLDSSAGYEHFLFRPCRYFSSFRPNPGDLSVVLKSVFLDPLLYTEHQNSFFYLLVMLDEDSGDMPAARGRTVFFRGLSLKRGTTETNLFFKVPDASVLQHLNLRFLLVRTVIEQNRRALVPFPPVSGALLYIKKGALLIPVCKGLKPIFQKNLVASPHPLDANWPDLLNRPLGRRPGIYLFSIEKNAVFEGSAPADTLLATPFWIFDIDALCFYRIRYGLNTTCDLQQSSSLCTEKIFDQRLSLGGASSIGHHLYRQKTPAASPAAAGPDPARTSLVYHPQGGRLYTCSTGDIAASRVDRCRPYRDGTYFVVVLTDEYAKNSWVD